MICIASFSFISHPSHLSIHQYLIGQHLNQAKAQVYQHDLRRNRHHLQAPFLAKLLQYQTSRLPRQAKAQVCQLSHHLNPRYNHLKPLNHLVNHHLNLLVSPHFSRQSQGSPRLNQAQIRQQCLACHHQYRIGPHLGPHCNPQVSLQ